MLNLLWSALNLLLLLSVFYILFRAAKLVKQHMGGAAMMFFLLALLVIGGRNADADSEAPKNLLARPTNKSFGNAGSQQQIALGGSNSLTLLGQYRTANGLIEPLGLYPTVSGIMLGHRWKPIGGLLHQVGPQMQYDVVLHHQWQLLGMQAFGQIEQFKGTMPAPKLP